MKRLLYLIALSLGTVLILAAQVPGPQSPDCTLPFSFTAAPTNSPIRQNYIAGGTNDCTYWQFAYTVSSNGTVTSLQIIVQSAPAGVDAVTPGTFVTYAGVAKTGSATNTNIVGAQAFLSNDAVAIPWIRVRLAALSATGITTVYGVLQGWNAGNAAGAAAVAAGCPNPCPVQGTSAAGMAPVGPPVQNGGTDGALIRALLLDAAGRTQEVGAAAAGAPPAGNPVQIGGFDTTNIQPIAVDTSGREKVVGAAADGSPPAGAPVLQGFYDGTNAKNQFGCTNQALITITAGTDAVIVTGVAATTTRICHIDFVSDTVATFTIRQGTGTTCLTNTASIAGPYPSVLTFAADYQPLAALRTTIAARDVCLHSSASATVGGVAIYATIAP